MLRTCVHPHLIIIIIIFDTVFFQHHLKIGINFFDTVFFSIFWKLALIFLTQFYSASSENRHHYFLHSFIHHQLMFGIIIFGKVLVSIVTKIIFCQIVIFLRRGRRNWKNRLGFINIAPSAKTKLSMFTFFDHLLYISNCLTSIQQSRPAQLAGLPRNLIWSRIISS